MKYLDEYRDPVLARKLLAELRATATKPWAIMEVCGGQTHTLVRQGIDELLPMRHPDDPRARLPGVRHPAGDDRPGRRARRPPGRDLHQLR